MMETDVPVWASGSESDWQTDGRVGLQHGEPGAQTIKRKDGSRPELKRLAETTERLLKSKIKIDSAEKPLAFDFVERRSIFSLIKL